jgi:hypothetical protein
MQMLDRAGMPAEPLNGLGQCVGVGDVDGRPNRQ